MFPSFYGMSRYEKRTLCYCDNEALDDKLIHYLNMKDTEELKKLIDNPNHKIYLHKLVDGACRKNNLELVKYLFEEKQLDPKTVEDGVCGVLNGAINSGNFEISKYLLEKGFTGYRTTTDHGIDKKILYMLIEHKIDIDDDLTLGIFVESGDTEVVEKMLEHGYYESNKRPRNLLKDASNRKFYKILVMLQKAQKKLDEKELSYKMEALKLAKENGDSEIVDILEDKVNPNSNKRNKEMVGLFDLMSMYPSVQQTTRKDVSGVIPLKGKIANTDLDLTFDDSDDEDDIPDLVSVAEEHKDLKLEYETELPIKPITKKRYNSFEIGFSDHEDSDTDEDNGIIIL